MDINFSCACIGNKFTNFLSDNHVEITNSGYKSYICMFFSFCRYNFLPAKLKYA